MKKKLEISRKEEKSEKIEKKIPSVEYSEVYEDPIQLKMILEMDDPVFIPQSGRIYDRQGIMEYIRHRKAHGLSPTDPENDTIILNPDMLISARVIKQEAERLQKKITEVQSQILNNVIKFNKKLKKKDEEIESLNTKFEKNVDDKMNAMMDRVNKLFEKERNEFKKENKKRDKHIADLTDKIDALTTSNASLESRILTLETENNELKTENSTLKESIELKNTEINNLKSALEAKPAIEQKDLVSDVSRCNGHRLFFKFGDPLIEKLNRLECPVKKKLLKKYSDNAKNSKSDTDLQKVVSPGWVNRFYSTEINNHSERNKLIAFFLLLFDVNDETTKVAVDFAENVNKYFLLNAPK